VEDVDPALIEELPPAPSRDRGAGAGVLGAGAALVVVALVSLADADGASVTVAVQNRFIDTFAGSLRSLAVSWFGTNDKAAIKVGTVLVVLLLGAAVGALAQGRVAAVAGAFAAFGGLGIACAAGDPLASLPVAIVASALGASAGTATAVGMERRWRLPVPRDRGTASDGPAPSRRSVLVSAAGTGVALLAGGLVAGAARSSMRQAKRVAVRVLPRPSRRVPVPARQPFQVQGLSPYVTPTADFYRIDTAVDVPVVDPDTWTLRITGSVDHERTYTYAELLGRKLVEVPITIQCVSNEVGGPLVGTARWIGVPLTELLREAGVQAGADQIIGRSVDGFTAGFPTKVAFDGRQALVALGMSGRSLPPEHGFPARLIVPGLYGYVSATKWLKEIRLTTFSEEQGYWVPLGWSRLGPIKTQSRIDVPVGGARVGPGPTPIAGVAWAPTRGISKVEVQVDDGPWQAAELGRVASDDTWVQWRLLWQAPSGRHTLTVRATDGTGAVQTGTEAPPDPDGATGHHTVVVDVA
jgi:DMSO/TMAO reductase YedYZ molybdopterin-dependent catalytic subunit